MFNFPGPVGLWQTAQHIKADASVKTRVANIVIGSQHQVANFHGTNTVTRVQYFGAVATSGAHLGDYQHRTIHGNDIDLLMMKAPVLCKNAVAFGTDRK